MEHRRFEGRMRKGHAPLEVTLLLAMWHGPQMHRRRASPGRVFALAVVIGPLALPKIAQSAIFRHFFLAKAMSGFRCRASISLILRRLETPAMASGSCLSATCGQDRIMSYMPALAFMSVVYVSASSILSGAAAYSSGSIV